jgi:hypothetical protein
MYKKIAIYDFDDTIFKSPTREQGEIDYFKLTGNKWPHVGWYGRVETLSPPLVPQIPPRSFLIESTYQAFLKDKQNPQAKVILLTGRPYKMRHRIQEILSNFGMVFDQEFYRGQPGTTGSDTFQIKMNIIRGLLTPEIELLEIYEDRPEHVSGFIDQFKKLKTQQDYPKQYIVHDVKGLVLHEPLVI